LIKRNFSSSFLSKLKFSVNSEDLSVKATQKLPVLISTKSFLNNCYDGELDYAYLADFNISKKIGPGRLSLGLGGIV